MAIEERLYSKTKISRKFGIIRALEEDGRNFLYQGIETKLTNYYHLNWQLRNRLKRKMKAMLKIRKNKRKRKKRKVYKYGN